MGFLALRQHYSQMFRNRKKRSSSASILTREYESLKLSPPKRAKGSDMSEKYPLNLTTSTSVVREASHVKNKPENATVVTDFISQCAPQVNLTELDMIAVCREINRWLHLYSEVDNQPFNNQLGMSVIPSMTSGEIMVAQSRILRFYKRGGWPLSEFAHITLGEKSEPTSPSQKVVMNNETSECT